MAEENNKGRPPKYLTIEKFEEEITDIRILQNEQAETLQEIKTNHLPHLNLKINITLGGLVFIAIMIALLGCMIAWAMGVA